VISLRSAKSPSRPPVNCSAVCLMKELLWVLIAVGLIAAVGVVLGVIGLVIGLAGKAHSPADDDEPQQWP
jgi:hypothetical protein